MNLKNDSNPFGSFLDLIEAGATVEDAAEITGITPEELAQCREIDPKFDAGLEALAPDPWIDRLYELLKRDNEDRR